jgi:hypothetical protein
MDRSGNKALLCKRAGVSKEGEIQEVKKDAKKLLTTAGLVRDSPSSVRNQQALIDFLVFDEGTIWGLIWVSREQTSAKIPVAGRIDYA